MSFLVDVCLNSLLFKQEKCEKIINDLNSHLIVYNSRNINNIGIAIPDYICTYMLLGEVCKKS